MSELGEAALNYAARGIHVLPIHGLREDGSCTCGRGTACPTPGKHPILAGTVEKTSSIDPIIVGQWWTTYPRANIGIACGPRNRLWVLDIDGAHGLMELEQYEEQRQGGPLPTTARVRTGSGGLHFFWAWDDGTRLRTKIGSHFGVDVKANGFVVAPPSRHASGGVYKWEIEGEILPAPDDLIRWLKGDPGEHPEDEWPSITEMLKSGIAEGRRDDGVFHAALTLKRSGMQRHEAEAIIERIALRCNPPFPPEQARAKVDAAWKYDEEEAQRRTRDSGVDAALKAWADTAGVGRPPDPPIVDADQFWPGFGGVTDRDNAERLRACWDDAVPLVGGGWIVWESERWVRNERPSLAASHKLHEILSREMQLVDLTTASVLAKWRQACGSVSRVNAALSLMESDPSLSVGDLDPDPWLLGVKNGVLDLRTGELREYRREDMITRRANAEWFDGQVDCPTFKQTLGYGVHDEHEVVAGEIASALQAFFGVCLTGAPVKNFLVLYGPGNTGKSSLIEAFAYALGDYAASAPRGLLTMRRGSNETHPTILTELEGRRFVYASEPGAGEELNVELIKDITGGATLKARRMRQDFYEFRTEAKPVIDTNHPLRLRDVSPALEERMINVGLLSAVPPEKRASRGVIAEQLKLEANGVLAWAWRGLMRVLEAGGGIMPGDLTSVLGESIIEERRDAIAEQDVVARFITECLVEGTIEDVHSGVFLTAGVVRSRYLWWAALHDVGMVPDVFMRELRQRLKAGVGMSRRYEPVKARESGGSGPVQGWRGLRLQDVEQGA